MFLHQAAYVDQNLRRADYPGQMYGGSKIQHREEMYVNMHVLRANWWFQDDEHRKYYRLRWVVFQAEVALALQSALESADCIYWAEVHLFNYVSSVFVDFLQCHFGKEGIWACSFDEA